MPPPVQIGERLEPARARPVPFCRHGLAPPPETIARVLVAAVPRRRAACSARTLWCTRGPWKPAPKADSSSFTFLDAPAVAVGLSTGASSIATHLHDSAARSRHRPTYKQEILLGIHRHDL